MFIEIEASKCAENASNFMKGAINLAKECSYEEKEKSIYLNNLDILKFLPLLKSYAEEYFGDWDINDICMDIIAIICVRQLQFPSEGLPLDIREELLSAQKLVSKVLWTEMAIRIRHASKLKKEKQS